MLYLQKIKLVYHYDIIRIQSVYIQLINRHPFVFKLKINLHIFQVLRLFNLVNTKMSCLIHHIKNMIPTKSITSSAFKKLSLIVVMSVHNKKTATNIEITFSIIPTKADL